MSMSSDLGLNDLFFAMVLKIYQIGPARVLYYDNRGGGGGNYSTPMRGMVELWFFSIFDHFEHLATHGWQLPK